MNTLVSTQITNFGQWCVDRFYRGGIHVIGDKEFGYELSITDDTAEDAYRWLASRYDPKKGESCIDFIIDGILNMDWSPDGYAAKLLVSALDCSDPSTLVTTMRMVRHNYVQKAVEHFKSNLVELHESRGPDPMDVRKEQIERYRYQPLVEG